MKKYAIIIGENNEDLSRRVQEALFAVGFEWCGPPRQGVMHTDAMLLFVNCSGNGEFHFRETEGELKSIGEIDDAVLTAPSYVIENAHKLDGAVPQKEPKKMTVAQVSALVGEEVEIVA